MAVLSRADWRAKPPTRPMATLDRHQVRYWTVHYDGTGPLAGRDPGSLMRAFQRYHQVTRGFADIAYNSGVFQDGTEAVGRGPFVGGHLLGAQNRQSWGTIAAIGKTETPSAMLLDALRRDYRSACEWAGRELEPRGHTDWPNANKPCPGGDLLAFIRTGGLTPGVVVPPLVVPPLVAPTPVGRRTLRLTSPLMRGDDVRQLQSFALRVFPSYAHGIDRAGGADGVYGRATGAWVEEFQRRTGLKPDQVVGSATWAALERHGFR